MDERAGDFYTAPQAAKVLRVTPQRIRTLVREGKLEGEKRDGEWMIASHSVHARLEEQRNADVRAKNQASSSEWIERVAQLERQLGRLEGRLELSEKAESTIIEERNRILEELQEERAERRRLQAELDAARRPWWSKLFRP